MSVIRVFPIPHSLLPIPYSLLPIPHSFQLCLHLLSKPLQFIAKVAKQICLIKTSDILYKHGNQKGEHCGNGIKYRSR
jgi:hypothetical protein